NDLPPIICTRIMKLKKKSPLCLTLHILMTVYDFLSFFSVCYIAYPINHPRKERKSTSPPPTTLHH
ncbi:hypothetical protein COCVIDRAFT_102758, partial [Bipolaris victoriae FI3]